VRAVNLLPREDSKRPRERMTLASQLALVLPFVVASLIGAGYLLASSKVNDKKATLNALQSELEAIPHVEDKPQANALLAVQRDQRIAALGSRCRRGSPGTGSCARSPRFSPRTSG
jgi:hypothetical protein